MVRVERSYLGATSLGERPSWVTSLTIARSLSCRSGAGWTRRLPSPAGGRAESGPGLAASPAGGGAPWGSGRWGRPAAGGWSWGRGGMVDLGICGGWGVAGLGDGGANRGCGARRRCGVMGTAKGGRKSRSTALVRRPEAAVTGTVPPSLGSGSLRLASPPAGSPGCPSGGLRLGDIQVDHGPAVQAPQAGGLGVLVVGQAPPAPGTGVGVGGWRSWRHCEAAPRA